MDFNNLGMSVRYQHMRSSVARRFGLSLSSKSTLRFCEFLQRSETGCMEHPLNVVLELTPFIPENHSRGWKARTHRLNSAKSRFAVDVSGLIAALSKTESRFQLCWLSRSILVQCDVELLSELAEDPQIVAIDTPVPLSIEDGAFSDEPAGPFDFSEYGCTGKDVVIAVIDSEVKHDHPALQGRVVQKRNYTQEDWGNPHWHGTAVAGIIGASSPGWGVAPDCEIWNYKVIPIGDPENISDFQGALALQEALEDGAQVANCSWGAGPIGNGRSRIALACEQAWDFGLTVVKSAGNGTLTCPGEAAGIIVVGACDLAGTHVPTYSGRGLTFDNRPLPDLVAPGGTQDQTLNALNTHDSIGPIGFGTSFAAPWASGTACRLLEGRTELEPDEIKNVILQMCERIPGADSLAQGAGLLAVTSQVTPGYTDSTES